MSTRARARVLGVLVTCIGIVLYLSLGDTLRPFLFPPRYANPTPEDGFHEYLYGDLGGGTEAALPELFYLATVTAFPERFGRTRQEILDRYGFVENPDSGLPYGAVRTKNLLRQTFLQSNCALCHTGRVNGQIVHGIGNHDLSLTLLTRDIAELITSGQLTEGVLVDSASAYQARGGASLTPQDNVLLRIVFATLRQRLADQPDLARLDVTPGRNSPVEFAKLRLAMGLDTPPGSVKFPAIWYWDRTRTRFTSDGSFVGQGLYLPLAPEFTKGRDAAGIVRDLSPIAAVVTWAEATPPPPYPGQRQPQLEERGQRVFTGECGSCHGTYRPGGSFDYPENVVPWGVVRTDRARLDAITPDLVRRYNRAELSPYLRLQQTEGYLAPNLQGIWARAPYLHNASVPTLDDLLRPPDQRPAFFYVGQQPEYDLDRMGIRCTATVEGGRRGCTPTRPEQFRFDTTAPGNGNGGHEFGTQLPPPELEALMAYLKSL